MRTSRVPRWLRTIHTHRACRPTACPAVASKSSPARSSLRSTRRAARSYMPGRSPAHSLGVKQRKRQFLLLESSFYLRVGDCCGPGGQCVYRGERGHGTVNHPRRAADQWDWRFRRQGELRWDRFGLCYVSGGWESRTYGRHPCHRLRHCHCRGWSGACLSRWFHVGLGVSGDGGCVSNRARGRGSPPFVGPSDAFVAKLNPTGSAMVWATFLGGSGNDQAQTIAVDSAGDVWVSGITKSTDFPTKVSVTSNGSEFLAELNSTGSALSYSALFPSDTVAAALAVDADGTVHVGGATGPISAFSPGSAPGLTSAPWMFGIANAAGGVLSGRLAPGELISIYGLHLGPSAPVSATFNAAGFLPTTLGGVQQPRIGRQPRPFAAAARIAAVTAGAVAGEEYWAGVGGQQGREKQPDSHPHHLNRQPPRANRTPPSRPSTVSTHPHSDKSCDPSGSRRTRYSRGASVPVPYAPGRTR